MTNHEAEARPRRFTDQRGIALQTVIITVVMIAIAGAIAAVLFSSAQDATNELENASVSVNAWTARNEGQCQRSGGTWSAPGATAPAAGNAATGADAGALQVANRGTGVTLVGWDINGEPTTTAAQVLGYCKG